MKIKEKTTKKLKTMNDISAVDAEIWILEFLQGPDVRGEPPAWFGEVGARDFLECAKIYADLIYGASEQVEGNLSAEQMAELSNVAAGIPDGELRKLLSETEYEVMTLILQGFTNLNIATKRGKSEKTIAAQVLSILRKLGVNTRSQAIAKITGLSNT
jgi:DNA-binding CsgD family transcriptional regulator